MTTPKRIISLVPSETYNLYRLNSLPSLLGRTRYCVEPPETQSIPTVGGTKDVAIDQVLALEPDLILANQEENTRKDIEALMAVGLNVRIVFPKTVEEGLIDFQQLADLLAVDNDILRASRNVARIPAPHRPRRCFVPIWRNPWMTFNDETYLGDVLRWLGMINAFGAEPSKTEKGKDLRYPCVKEEQILMAQPEIVLLPDEPYPFGEKHRTWFASLDIPAAHSGEIHLVNGRDLCWHGAWAVDGLKRLRDQIIGN